MQRLFALFLFLFLAVLFPFQAAFSQEESTIEVMPPDLEGFPEVNVQFRFTKDTIQPVRLDLEQVSVLENNQEVSILSLEQINKGVHFSLVINGGREFDLRDAIGVSPYQKTSDVLLEWANSRRFDPNDAWSFVTHEGVAIRNTSSPEAWVTALEAYQPNFRMMAPRLDALETAIQMADEWIVPFGVGKTLLYLTPPPSADQIDAINALAQTALFGDIRVYVLMIGDAYFLTNQQGKALSNLATVTGGGLFHFTDVESLPDLETMFSSQGIIYDLIYLSQVRQPGSYPLRIQVDLPEGQVGGESQPFYVNVLPPKPIFLCPPASITRKESLVQGALGKRLLPEEVSIEIMIEFPDGYSREITASRLYVDEILIYENETPPYDRLVWDLEEIIKSGEYVLQVEVEDALGLSSRTIAMPIVVDVEMDQSENNIDPSRQKIGLLLSGGILLIALVILLVWSIQRIRELPFTQTLKSRWLTHTRMATSEEPQLPVGLEQAFATLDPLDGKESPEVFFIQEKNVILGRDREHVDIRIDAPGIDPVHAQIRVRSNRYYLNDLGSSSGTWLNYERIGTRLEEVRSGDIVYLGMYGFRFTIIGEQAQPQFTISKYEPL